MMNIEINTSQTYFSISEKYGISAPISERDSDPHSASEITEEICKNGLSKSSFLSSFLLLLLPPGSV